MRGSVNSAGQFWQRHYVHNVALTGQCTLCIIIGMNELSKYIDASGLTQEQFAEKIGADQSIVSRLYAGKIRPSLQRAFAIERATNGAVPVSSWVSEK